MVDRPIVQVGELPCAEDVLGGWKDTMFGLGYLAQATIGTSTGVNGFSIAPTIPASLSFSISPGSIYAVEPADQTAYGVLGTDSTSIVKQGLLTAAVTLTVTPPTTSGFSQVYIVQVAYSDVDTGTTLVPFFNSADPSSPSSATENTIRQGQAVVELKAGTAASTGSQQTPSPDAGFVALWAILVSNGVTTVTSANFTRLAVNQFSTPWFPNLENLPSLFVPVVPATTWFVDGTLGTDAAGQGLSAGLGAFKTIQFAVNTISAFFSAGQVTINVADGTYAGSQISASLISSWNIIGGGVGSTVINVTSAGSSQGNGFNVVGSKASLSQMLIQTSVSGGAGIVGNQSSVNISNCNFGSCNSGCIVGDNQALVTLSGSITVTGNSNFFTGSNSGSTVQYAGQSTTLSVTFTGTPTFSTATVFSQTFGNTLFFPSNTTLTGSVNGQRYLAAPGGGINTQGSGVDFISGSSAGVAANSTSITIATGALAGFYL
jgi:hypothetical protein